MKKKMRRGGSELSPKISAKNRLKPTNRSRTIKKIFSDLRKGFGSTRKITPGWTHSNRDKTIRKMFKSRVNPEMGITINPLNI